MKYFRKIKSDVDVQPFFDEIEAIPDAWHLDVRRQTNIKVQRESENIALRGPVRSGNDQRKLRDVHESRYTRQASKFPRTVAFLKVFAREQNAELSRARLVRLVPGHRVYPHIDGGDYYRVRNRYHLVIHSSLGSSMKAGDEEVRMQPGELWWFDNKARHESFNDGDVERIHLIFDLLPASEFEELFGESFVPNDVDAGRITADRESKKTLKSAKKSKSIKAKTQNGSKSERAKSAYPPDESAAETIGRRSASIVIDQASGEMLINDKGAVLFHPAGLTKLMVLHEMFDALRHGDLSLRSQISIPRETSESRRSIFEPGEGITIQTAIRALVQRQTNAVALARAIDLCGDEQKYAEYLTARAHSLGMSATRFVNTTGRDHPDQVSTPIEIMKLCHILIRDFPERFAYFGETSFSRKGRTYTNRNLLLGSCEGVDGLYSARTRVSGHHLAVTAERGGRRLVALVAGAGSTKDSANRAAGLLNKAFEAGPRIQVAELVAS